MVSPQPINFSGGLKEIRLFKWFDYDWGQDDNGKIRASWPRD